MDKRDVGESQAVGATPSDDYEVRENQWDQAWPGSDDQERVHPTEEIDNLDEVSAFPDVVGTRDTIEAVRDGEPYMPPEDPPVLPGGAEGIHVSTGFGTSVEEETERDTPYASDADMQDDILLMLQQDSLTSHYTLIPTVVNGVVTIRGLVSDVQDAEHAQAIVGEIDGVVDVVDEMTVDPNAESRLGSS